MLVGRGLLEAPAEEVEDGGEGGGAGVGFCAEAWIGRRDPRKARTRSRC